MEGELSRTFAASSDLHGALLRCAKDNHYATANKVSPEEESERAIYVSFQRLAANFVVFLESHNII